MRNALFVPLFFLNSIYFIAQFLCERSIQLLVLLYRIVVHKKEIQKCKYLGHVSFIYHVWCFWYSKPENDTDFEFVFGHCLICRKLKRTIKLTRAGALRQTYFLIWPQLHSSCPLPIIHVVLITKNKYFYFIKFSNTVKPLIFVNFASTVNSGKKMSAKWMTVCELNT